MNVLRMHIMTHEQRTVLTRIPIDMIKADNNIEESENMDMKRLMCNYSITQQKMSDARKIRFSDVVNMLKELLIRERKAFIDHIYRIAQSVNICVPHEILLLIALQQVSSSTDNELLKKEYIFRPLFPRY